VSNTKNSATRILEHPDKDEIISKLILIGSSSDIAEWLRAKYTNPGESRFHLGEKVIKSFQDNYLDLYVAIKEDILKTKEMQISPEQELELSVKNNKTYKEKMLELAGKEVDIKSMITNMIAAIETRAGQVFDSIQEDPRNMRADRVLIEWFDLLGGTLEKYHKLVNGAPDQIIQHNVTLQVVDQHINVFYDVIREVLSQMDIETSLYFMELFNEKISKLKPPSEKDYSNPDLRLAEAKIINENINNKLNETNDA
jgi:hypothetical protein